MPRAPVRGLMPRNSVLGSGGWYKVSVPSGGIYKMDYAFFESLGLNPSSINPRNIRVYGNGGAQLAYANATFRYDDLQENAIFVAGEGDGVFNSSDYVLFYATSPTSWKFNATDRRYHHQTHSYSDSAYYFITTDLGPGKRIQSVASSGLAATDAVTSFDDFQVHEQDLVNLLKSGRRWYGESVDLLGNTISLSFTVTHRDVADSLYVNVSAAGRSQNTFNYFTVNVNGAARCQVANSAASPQYFLEYARENTASSTFINGNQDVTTTLVFSSSDNTAIGWLNYMEINARRTPELFWRGWTNGIQGCENGWRGKGGGIYHHGNRHQQLCLGHNRSAECA
jgi:hypothetical protein